MLKVGVNILDYADKLQKDYGVCIASTLDLRYLAKKCIFPPDDLNQLSETHLRIDIYPKDWRMLVIDWKLNTVSKEKIKYVAKTVHATVELFKVFEGKLTAEKCFGNRKKFIDDYCLPCLGEDFPKRKIVTVKKQHYVLPKKDIRIVNNTEECEAVVAQLRLYGHAIKN